MRRRSERYVPTNPEQNYPEPLPHIRCRILGPERVNGMETWRVMKYDRDNGQVVESQVGDCCMTFREAEGRAKDVLMEKKVVYVGPHRFERTAL